MACNILSSPIPVYIALTMTVNLISLFKTLLKVKPMTYLEMDHEKMFKILLVIITLIVSLECLGIYLVNGTLCHSTRIDVMTHVFGLNLDKSQFMSGTVFKYLISNFLLVQLDGGGTGSKLMFNV